MDNLYVKPAKILEQLKLIMPIAVTLEDPISRAPVTLAYENLHQLLVLDVPNLMLESQVIANLYAEMARFQRAAEYRAARAEVAYRKWKSAKVDELREARKKAGAKEKAPTVAEGEAYYRDHAEYEEKSEEPERWKAIAGLFDDLKWAFRMKSDHIKDASRTLAGYERAAGAEARAEERLTDYRSLAEEAADIAKQSGSSEAARALLEGEKPARQARPLEG